MKKVFCYLLLLSIPLMMVFTISCLNKAKGPSWVGMNCDPDYNYLLNSLHFARMKKIGHIVHPGTTVQITGAIVLRVTHLLHFSSNDDLQTDVIKNPELYLSVINKVYVGINTLLLIFLGIVIFWLTKSLALSIIVQLAPFYPNTLSAFIFGLTGARPESLLFFTSLLFAFLIVIYAYKDTEKFGYFISNTRYIRRFSPHSLFTICFSVVSGFGLVTKFSFMYLLVIPLIILPTYKCKIKYIIGTSLSFIFFSLPIIKDYGRVFSWIFSAFLHAKVHGTGAATIIDPHLFLFNAKTLLRSEVFFSIILFSSLCILVISYTVPMFRKASFGNINFRLLLGVSLAQLLGFVLVAKHSRGWDYHYLLPASSLSGVTLVLIILWLRQLFYSLEFGITDTLTAQKVRQVIFNLDSKLLLLIIIPFLFFARKDEIKSIYNWKVQTQHQRLSVYDKAENDYKDYAKIYYLSSTSPAFALRLGSNPDYAMYYDDGIKRDYSGIFTKLYPNTYFFLIFNGKYFNWGNEVSFEEILAKHGRQIIFQGPVFEELFRGITGSKDLGNFKKPDLLLKDVFKGKNEGLKRETIYEIDFTTENVPSVH